MQGAEVSCNSLLKAQAGRQYIILKNLSSKLYESTVQVRLPANVTLLSLTTERNFLEQTKSPERIEALKDSIRSDSQYD